MPLRIVKVIFLFIATALVLAFANVNSAPTSLSIGDGNTIHASVGALVLGSFAFGILLALLGASLYAARSYFRERSLKLALKNREQIEKQLLELRSLARGAPEKEIEKKYKALVKQAGVVPFARLEYSRWLIAQGKAQQAIIELTEARKIGGESSELLFLTADAHKALGNQTAALETLSIILTHEPDSLYALEQASLLSFTLTRFEDCQMHLQSLQEVRKLTIKEHALLRDAEASIIIRDTQSKSERAEKLLTFAMRNDSAVALEALATLKEQEGAFDESAQCMMRIYKIQNNAAWIKKAVHLWLKNGKASEALSALQTWERVAVGDEKIAATIELIKAYMLLGQEYDASKTIELLQNDKNLSELQLKELSVLRALIALRQRDASGTAVAIQEVERLALRAGND